LPQGFDVARSGDGRVAMIGFPSVGKSSLLNELTETESLAAGYEFTTLTCIPGNVIYNDTKIQLLDLPGIIEGAAYGRGRGREVRCRTHVVTVCLSHDSDHVLYMRVSAVPVACAALPVCLTATCTVALFVSAR
jgi:ribosome-interacting GTPase 1